MLQKTGRKCQSFCFKRCTRKASVSLTSIILTYAQFGPRIILTLIRTSDRLTPCETGLIEKSGLRKHGGFDILISLDAN